MAIARRELWSRLLATSGALASLRAAAGATAGIDDSQWQRVLDKYVSAIGEVDYAGIQKDRGDLDNYVQQIAGAAPWNKPERFPTPAAQLAYYINAYNALVTAGVVKSYPAKSVRDLGALYGFFRRDDYVMGGRKISLQTLERKFIQSKEFSEPRIHFAIVCASLSCPKLSKKVFRAETLEAQLAEGARQFVAERRNVLVEGETVTLSEIFKWYDSDFRWKAPSVIDFVKLYAAPELKAKLAAIARPRIKFVDYDWSINDPGSRVKAKSPYEREIAKS